MKFLICFISLTLYSLVAISQIEKKETIQPIVYKMAMNKDGKLYGYFKTISDTTFIYLGTSYLGYGSNNLSYVSYQEGNWRITEGFLKTFNEIKVSKNHYANDSLVHKASNRFNQDSCYFNISVLDKNENPISGAIVAWSAYENRYFGLNNSGQLIKQFKRVHDNSRLQVIQPTEYYATSIVIDSNYNFHEFKIYPKKYPEKMGLLVDGTFAPLGLNLKINNTKDTIILGKRFILTPAIQSEFEEYLQAVIKVNPQFKSYLEDIKAKFYP